MPVIVKNQVSKVHAPSNQGKALCKTNAALGLVAAGLDEVTCKKCIRKTGDRSLTVGSVRLFWKRWLETK